MSAHWEGGGSFSSVDARATALASSGGETPPYKGAATGDRWKRIPPRRTRATLFCFARSESTFHCPYHGENVLAAVAGGSIWEISEKNIDERTQASFIRHYREYCSPVGGTRYYS